MDENKPIFLFICDDDNDLLQVRFTEKDKGVLVESNADAEVPSLGLYGLLYATLYHLMDADRARGQLRPLFAEEMQAISRLLDAIAREE